MNHETNIGVRLQDSIAQPNIERSLDQPAETQRDGTPRIKVRIISYRSRFLDITNLTGGAKYIEDALVTAGLIPDDSPEFIDCTVSQEKALGKDQRTVIIIEYP